MDSSARRLDMSASRKVDNLPKRPEGVHTQSLVDEMEKAHADVFNVLLQILDDGRGGFSRAMVSFKYHFDHDV